MQSGELVKLNSLLPKRVIEHRDKAAVTDACGLYRGPATMFEKSDLASVSDCRDTCVPRRSGFLVMHLYQFTEIFSLCYNE